MIDSKEKVERICGTRDVLPDEYEKRQFILKKLQKVFQLFGYRGLEVHTIELYLRKLGEAIRRNMYYFKNKGNENICLRSELTASIARLFNSELQNADLPQKLYYHGSAFRYVRP